MSNTLLEIKDLNISFNLNNKISKTVSNFNINLKKKKTIGIVGESGSGKTLSMLALTRLLPKQAFVEKGKITKTTSNDCYVINKRSRIAYC